MSKVDYESWATLRAQVTHNLVAAMKHYSTTEAVGILHLERLDFVPAGIERGELVHSVPLTPGEEVNITHKEWSNTSEEFAKLAIDFKEAYSDEGVTEKAELTQSTSSQDQHSSGFNTGVTASGGYGPVTISTSLSLSVNDSASRSEQIARNHSITTTRKASSRSKQEHKMSFKVASAAGTEDQQVRRIRNPFPDRATRVDYYQLVRKWRVDLCRYGLRLTYDLTIPEPGAGLLARLKEIDDLKAALEMGFGDPKAIDGSPASFTLQPDEIEESNVSQLAAKYGAGAIEPYPGAADDTIEVTVSAGFLQNEDAKYAQLYGQTIKIPDGQRVTSAQVIAMTCRFWSTDEGWLEMVTPLQQRLFNPDGSVVKPFEISTWKGPGGELPVVVEHYRVSQFSVIVRVDHKAAPDTLNAWRMKVYSTIRDAAQARYEQYRQGLKDRLARLQEEQAGQDPLSLRKVEREEVMKGVIRWLLGPDFDFAAPVPAEVLPSEVAVFSKEPLMQEILLVIMSMVLAYGETTTLLHQAIEWENMLYVLYPYFWSHPSRWEFKKYLNHDDLMHRTFLKAGSARVVLTIRPGFERAFVALLEIGTADAEHPYVTIASEMEAYAKTNYPGVRAANPIEGARPLLSPRQRKAWKDMQDIMIVLEAYNDAQHSANPGLDATVKVYPTTDQGLVALEPLVPLVDKNDKTLVAALQLTDPWDNPYVYASPGLANDYELLSYGADGAVGGDDAAADITNWAEANLIGRWYEYTPTSALDIAFDETSPQETPVTP